MDLDRLILNLKGTPAALCLLCVFGSNPAAREMDTIAPPGISRVTIDTAGKKKLSGVLGYVIDTHAVHVTIHPSGGVYNRIQTVTFEAPQGIQVYYTFDPIAPPEWFKKFEGAVVTPSGINKLRYFGRDDAGRMSAIKEQEFILDTIPPKIHLQVVEGETADTLKLVMKKRGFIRYTLDGTVPGEKSPLYRVTGDDAESRAPLLLAIPHTGEGILNAIAFDESGNQSRLLQWERKYDFVAPRLSMHPPGGRFNRAQALTITADKPSTIYYSLNGSDPREGGMLFPPGGIVISREGTTMIRCRGRDEAGNWSEEQAARFVLTTKSPDVQVRIDPAGQEGLYSVVLTSGESVTIYYEIGGVMPTLKSPVYAAPFSLRLGQTFAYFVTDINGNAGKIVIVDDLSKPKVFAVPDGGIFNTAVTIHFKATMPGVVYWRMLPDSIFVPSHDSATITEEGEHTVEYYVKLMNGTVSVVHRSIFFIDWTPPRVDVSIVRKSGDSITILLRSSKNATFYYTTNGSIPVPGQNAAVAGDKLRVSKDRITVARCVDCKFCFYAQDLAGNRSAVKTLNLSKPQVTADIPPSGSQPYNKMLSITLASDAGTTVHFSHHGKIPTLDSPVFSAPIFLVNSDTIIAFSVDGSGLVGDPDTFVYLIDLPPSAHFTTTPDTIISGEPVIFDASTSVDKESPLSRLHFRWDFDGKGYFDSKAVSDPRVSYVFSTPGRYSPRLEVTDERGNTGVFTCALVVHDRCPAGMVSAMTDNGHAVCIDRYEYPNIPGKFPRTSVSWVEAKISCIDAGKRLCTKREWESACRSGSGNTYPYGNIYEKNRCPTEGRKVWRSGGFSECSKNGIDDMVGNVWEWVEDKQEDYPLMMGGSFRDGKDANCGLAMPGSLSARTEDVGFRCCK
jgi:hypothetical protein